MKTVRLTIAFALALGLAACDADRVYEVNHEFTDRSWRVTDEPRYVFAIRDTSTTYALHYNIRNSLDYPYSRIFVMYHLLDSSGNELERKLVWNDLFDEKTGEPFGDSGLGDLYDHRFPLDNEVKFPFPGRFTIRLEQRMRQDTLQGVIAAGVRVDRVVTQ